MRFSLRNKHLPKTDGFTLIEVLIIAPAVIIVISGFVALMIALTSDVLSTREQSVLAFETQDALDRIEQDTRLTTQFLVTSGAQTTPQGSDSNFTGSAPFSSTNSLIMGGLTTDKNPVDSTRQLIYYAKQPNDCGSLQVYNRVFQAKIVYFVKNGSLWRRSLVPPYNTNATADDNTVCSTPWQRNSCSPGSSGALCETNDVEVMRGVKTFTVKYYTAPGSTTDIGSAQALNATTIEVIIEGEKTVAGRAITTSGTVRGTKLNNVDVDLPPPSKPSLSGTASGTNAVFTWSKVPVATSYIVRFNTNGGAPTEVVLNAQATSYTVSANLNDTVTLEVTARNATGNSTRASASVTIPSTTPPPLQSSWVNYGGEYSTAGYTKTTSDVVFLKGVIRDGNTATGTVIFTLPEGYRPTQRLIFQTDMAGPAPSRIDVNTNGDVIVDRANSYVILDGIRFVSSSASYAWTDLALENGWLNYGSGYAPLRSTVDSIGRAHFQGLVYNGTYTNPTTITNLPVGRRPAGYTHVPAASGASFNYTAFATPIHAKGINGSQTYYGLQAMYYPSSFSGWTNLAMQNGWVSFDTGGHPTPQYTKSADKVVTLKGMIKNGTITPGTVIANLPAGYRPKQRLCFATAGHAAHARVDVMPNGDVIVLHVIASTWLSLDPISFIAEQ